MNDHEIRILIVDDTELMREAYRFGLSLKSYTNVTFMESGEKAITLLGECAKGTEPVFDLVVSDYELGGSITGLEVIEAAKTACPDARIYMIATIPPAQVIKKLAAMSVAHFQKPIENTTLFALADEALEHAGSIVK